VAELLSDYILRLGDTAEITASITRRQLLQVGVSGGSLVLTGGAALAVSQNEAGAATADDPSKQLALLEALAYDFYGKALKAASKTSWSHNWTDAFTRARENESEHYASWTSSPPPPVGYEFSYSSSTWKSARDIISFALTLERQMVASYSAAFSYGPTLPSVANILPCHVQHAQYLEFIYGKNGKNINPHIVPYFRRAVPYPVFTQPGQNNPNPLNPHFLSNHVHGPGVATP
jgi:hypothetical protein